MSAAFTNATSFRSCTRKFVGNMWTEYIEGYSTMNIRLTLKDKKTNSMPKGLRIVLTTNASFLNALAAFKSFCCTKKEYICPYTSLGTAAILSVVYKHVVRCSFGGHRWKWECLLCITREGKKNLKTKLSNQKFIHLIWFPNNIAWFPSCFGETGKWEEWTNKGTQYTRSVFHCTLNLSF